MAESLDTKKKTYSIVCDDGNGPMQSITVNAGEMIVYDVCKIKDYEGGDYVPRKAKLMDHVVLPIGRWPDEEEKDEEIET